MNAPAAVVAWNPDVLAANQRALAGSQPWLASLAPGDQVTCQDGVWRVAGPKGPVAVHSRDPQREAGRQLDALFGGGDSVDTLVVIGLGLGYLLEELERRGWPGRVVAFEPEPGLAGALLARRDWGSWWRGDRLRLLTGPDYRGAADCWLLFGNGAREPGVIVNPVVARLYPEHVERARAVASRVRFDAQANADARRRFGGRYLLNTLSNLRALCDEGDVAALSGTGRGVPAIVVGAGPSLDASLADLRAVQDRALVIAVDTAARTLLMAGIEPHFVVAVDPGESNARHLTDLPDCPRTFLVTEASLDPEGLRAFQGRTFFFNVSNHEPWPWLAAHGRSIGRLRAWGSVLTSAFDLAVRLDCDPIVFAGSDLAFTGGRPYCRGVAHEEDWRRVADRGVPLVEQWKQQISSWPRVDDVDVEGGQAHTAAHLVAFRDWLAEQCAREPQRRFINATGAGILSGSAIRQMALCEAVPDSSAAADLRAIAKAGHRPSTDDRIERAASSLAAHLAVPASEAPREGDHEQTLARWREFADGLSRDRIARALAGALSPAPAPAVPLPAAGVAEGVFDAEWISPLLANMRLVWMPIPLVRMEHYAPSVRCFRFRTTAARLIFCAMRLPDGAVSEGGQPLSLGAAFDKPLAGEYCAWRGEFYFTGSDGSDPRDNGLSYMLLVPECVAYLETRSLTEVLSDGI